MIEAEENTFLSSVGPGTPMGELMRQYWVPAMLSSELADNDGPPVRVMLLGEPLIAFRTTSGGVGLIENHCPHRGASLFFGRNEGDGLRCVYHGWKYDVTGRCLETPNEPGFSRFKDHVRARAYPCRERGGVVWAYLGDREVPPPLPDLEANQLPEGETHASAQCRNCNWLQGLEGDLDTSHQGFLHHGHMTEADVPKGSFRAYIARDRAPRYEIEDTDYGTIYGAYRPAEPGEMYWRVAQYLFPFYAHTPQGVLGDYVVHRCWVPMDDTHTMVFTIEPKSQYNGDPPLKENTSGWFGRFQLVQDEENDYLIDRHEQKTRTFTGIKGIFVQDQAVTESMGELSDRSREHLGAADAMVTRVRRRMAAAARALADSGTVPPGVDEPWVYRVRAGGVILKEGADWLAETEALREAYVRHPGLDPRQVGF